MCGPTLNDLGNVYTVITGNVLITNTACNAEAKTCGTERRRRTQDDLGFIDQSEKRMTWSLRTREKKKQDEIKVGPGV